MCFKMFNKFIMKHLLISAPVSLSNTPNAFENDLAFRITITFQCAKYKLNKLLHVYRFIVNNRHSFNIYFNWMIYHNTPNDAMQTLNT